MKNLIFFCPFIFDGGLEKTLKVYSDYLSKYHKVFIVTNCKNNSNLKLTKNIKTINPKNKFFFKFRYLNNLFCIYLIIKYFKSNSVIFSMQDHLFLLFLKIIYPKKYKIILRTANAIINHKNIYERKNLKKFQLIKKISLIIYKLADIIITFSKDNKDYLRKFLKKENVHVVYNNFEIKKKILRKPSKKKFNVFFIGRLVDDKNPLFFIENLNDLNKQISVKAFVVGKGKFSEKIQNIYDLNQNLGKFYGYKINPFLKYFKKIDIFCITSKYDGTPNVLGEALSHGIPVLAPKNVGLSNLILKNGSYGFLYRPDSNYSFKRKITFITKNYNKSLNKASLGRLSLKRFNKENTLKKLNKIISSL